MGDVRIEGLNVENTLALAARLRERADGLPQRAIDPIRGSGIMRRLTSETKCGTVGCIVGEYCIWKGFTVATALNIWEFLGLSGYARRSSKIAYLGRWISTKHRGQFIQIKTIAGRLRVMASYLEWLTEATNDPA